MSQSNGERQPIVGAKTTRDDWNSRFRRVVEYFETVEDPSTFDVGNRIPDDDDPYVLHADHRAPLRPDAEKAYNWHILLNPWASPASRTAWVMDGKPLRPEETAHGAPEGGIVANEKDLEEVFAGRVVVCVALTKVAGIHSRGETWIHCDEGIKRQFEAVLESLEQEAGIEGGFDD